MILFREFVAKILAVSDSKVNVFFSLFAIRSLALPVKLTLRSQSPLFTTVMKRSFFFILSKISTSGVRVKSLNGPSAYTEFCLRILPIEE